MKAYRFMAFAAKFGARTFSRGSMAVAEFRSIAEMQSVGSWLFRNSIRHHWNESSLSIEVAFE